MGILIFPIDPLITIINNNFIFYIFYIYRRENIKSKINGLLKLINLIFFVTFFLNHYLYESLYIFPTFKPIDKNPYWHLPFKLSRYYARKIVNFDWFKTYSNPMFGLEDRSIYHTFITLYLFSLERLFWSTVQFRYKSELFCYMIYSAQYLIGLLNPNKNY